MPSSRRELSESSRFLLKIVICLDLQLPVVIHSQVLLGQTTAEHSPPRCCPSLVFEFEFDGQQALEILRRASSSFPQEVDVPPVDIKGDPEEDQAPLPVELLRLASSSRWSPPGSPPTWSPRAAASGSDDDEDDGMKEGRRSPDDVVATIGRTATAT